MKLNKPNSKKIKRKCKPVIGKDVFGKTGAQKTFNPEDNIELTPEELEAKEKALKILEQEAIERERIEAVDLFSERCTKEDEARIAYKKLFKQGILRDEFGEIYFGWFKSKDAFAFMRVHGSNGLCRPHVDYRDHADEIFEDQFVFANGHVFWK